jgi:hypothetical protein
VAGDDRGLPASVFTAKVDEIGVGGEGGAERSAVHGVPGGLQLADNVLERGSVGWC